MTTAMDGGVTIESHSAMGISGPQRKIVSHVFGNQTGQGVEVFPILGEKTWRGGIIEKLSQFRLLPPNWNSYGSPPPSPVAIKAAAWLVANILDETQPRPRVTPVSGGGIQFEWSCGEKELEFEFRPDGSVEFLIVPNRSSEGIEAKQNTLSGQVMVTLLSWLTTDNTDIFVPSNVR